MTEMAVKTAGVFVAVYTYAVMTNSPKKYLVWAGTSGALSGFVYFVCVAQEWNVVTATFWSALTAGLISHIFARLQKAPVTLFLIGGILPTVPGNGIYQIMYHVLENDRSMSSYYLTQTIEVAGAIALAIFLMDTFFRVLRRGEWKQDSLRYIKKGERRGETHGDK